MLYIQIVYKLYTEIYFSRSCRFLFLDRIPELLYSEKYFCHYSLHVGRGEIILKCSVWTASGALFASAPALDLFGKRSDE